MTPEEAQRFYSDNKKNGFLSDPENSVYDLFRSRWEKREEHKKDAKAKQGEAYSVKKIHAMAETISKLKAFQKLSDAEVDRGLFNSRSARRLQVDLLKKTYCVEPDKTADYIQKMRQLQANMKPKGSQSDEYKAMHAAVGQIASLDPKDLDVAFKLMQANERMFNSINEYAKGKKSVRTFEEGRNRYDNCMDALSVVNDHVSGLRDYAKQIVDRTNKVRDVKEGDEHFVDLKDFGASRAENAQKAKQPEQQRVNDVQSKTLQ